MFLHCACLNDIRELKQSRRRRQQSNNFARPSRYISLPSLQHYDMKLHVNTRQPVSFAIPELRNKQSFQKKISIPEILTKCNESDELWKTSNSLFIKWCFRRPRRLGCPTSLTQHGYGDIQYKIVLSADKHLRVQSFSWVLEQTRRVQSLQIWRWRTFKEVCSDCWHFASKL